MQFCSEYYSILSTVGTMHDWHSRDLSCYNRTRQSLFKFIPNSSFKIQYEVLFKIDILTSILSSTLSDYSEPYESSSSRIVFIERIGFSLWEMNWQVTHRIAMAFSTVLYLNRSVILRAWSKPQVHPEPVVKGPPPDGGGEEGGRREGRSG